MMLGARTAAWAKSGGGVITFLDYATSKDGSYFDTGVKIHQRPDAFKLKFRINSIRPGMGDYSYDSIFGARSNYIYQVRYNGGSGIVNIEFYDASGHYWDNQKPNEWIVIGVDAVSRKVYLNDDHSQTEANRNVTLDNTAWLGDVNMTGMSWKNVPADFDCAYLKLYTNNTWSHEYLPAIVDGVVGFYETNSKTFHPSEGTAPFIAGPKKAV